MTNAGTITGGNGGVTRYGIGGSGGTGVSLESGTLTNTGHIIGGTGGSGYYGGVGGGIGVQISGGGMLSTSGTIAGGSGADAVSFGYGGGTLALDPGAAFVGTVAASSAADLLELSSSKGNSTGTLTGGFGAQFTGFTNVAVEKGATWTLAGANALGSTSQIVDNGTLLVSGTLADAGEIGIATRATLGVTGAGSAEVGSVALNGGTLTGDATGAIAVGATAGAAGAITIDAGASVMGLGEIGGAAIVNNGSIVAENGTLTLATGLSGGASGTVNINSGAVLVADSSVSGNQITFGGPASLILVDPKAFTGTIGSFGSGDVIDEKKVNATTLTYAGGTLTLEHGSTVLDTLTFSGSYTVADFSLSSDGHGGTDINFASDATDRTESAAAGGVWHGHDASAPAFPLMLTTHFA